MCASLASGLRRAAYRGGRAHRYRLRRDANRDRAGADPAVGAGAGAVRLRYQFQAVASLAPLLGHLFGLDYTAIGTLIGLYLAAGVFLALPVGMLAGRFGDRVVLGSGLALMAVGGVICALGGGTAGIAIGRVVCGMGAVTIVVLQGKLIADWFEGSAFMLAIATTIASYPVGIGVAQFTQTPLANAAGWPAVFLTGSAIPACAAALFLAAFQPPAEERGRRSLALPNPRECLLVAVAGLIWTFYNAAYSGFLSYVPSLLHVRGASAAQAGIVMALGTWSNLPAMLLGGWLAPRIGNVSIMLVGSLGIAVSVAGIAAFGDGVLALDGWALVFGLIGSIHASVVIALGTLSARAERRAAGMGLFYTTYYMGGALLPALCGRAADIYGGPEGALYAAAVISLLALPAFFLHRALAHRPAVPALAQL